MNEMKMLEPKKKFFHQDLEYKESIWDKFGGMFGLFEENYVHEWVWWNVVIYLKVFELLFSILSNSQTLKPLAPLQAYKVPLILKLCSSLVEREEKVRK